MKERPIIFSTPMVQAILDGRKTMTRRIIKGMALIWLRPNMFSPEFVTNPDNFLCPYGLPGDKLWVRETFKIFRLGYLNEEIIYKADHPQEFVHGWKPSIFMPRAAARIMLKVISIRVERLQDISEEDCLAEGIESLNIPEEGEDRTMFNCYQCPGIAHHGTDDLCEDGFYEFPQDSFASLWKNINGHKSWESNPWVWVIEFEKLT